MKNIGNWIHKKIIKIILREIWIYYVPNPIYRDSTIKLCFKNEAIGGMWIPNRNNFSEKKFGQKTRFIRKQ